MELRELEKRFEEEKIACQPMKGACMKFIYPSPEMREMSDIDILIRSECMEKAQDVLGQMGYRLYRSVKHHDIYRKEPHIVLEAHRAMYDKTVNYTQYEYFSNLSRALPRDGYSCIYDFSREDFYIYMMAHMAKHFYQMGCGIRNLVDIYVYRRKYEKEMDNGYLEEEFEKLGLTAFTSHMKQLAQIWLGDAEGSEFYDQLFSYMLESGVYGKDENGIWNKFCRESMNGREVDRARLKVWYWFPPLYYMAEYYPWLEKHSWLLPCAWIVRGIHGIFQHKGTLKRHMIHEIDAERIRIYQNIYAQMKLDFR